MQPDFKPNKKLGQNFLRDKGTLEKICAAARLDSSDEVVEIGPGRGDLTRFILAAGAKVRAIEKDRRLVEAFPADIVSDPNFELTHGDAMKIGFEHFSRGRSLKMVSNLPYGISSGVLRILTENRDLFSLAVIMLQKEVAMRLVAPPGGKSYGALSSVIQMVFEAEKLFDVSPVLFNPRPAVTSSVVRLVPFKGTRLPLKSEKFYRKTVRAAFSERRKMVKNSLFSAFPSRDVARALEDTGVDGSRRAETLSLEEFRAISDRLFELLG
ncbi:MAG: ribosomal RNA small subunit methyltransferase A [Candidatus Mycalebacterium zealandia]|nr:MAG: ribosomal RNA small subunit methyltransferase A [Candidatus Mycalebacterium zealandia]